MKLLVVFLFLTLIIAAYVSAQNFPQPYDKYVNDFAGYLDVASVSELRGLLSSLEQNTTAEVVVVTVNTTEPLVPSQYRTELFNYWHIGKKGNDNGLLVLYAVNENRIEVEVGYGLEGILPDSKVGAILDESYVPYRDSNQTAKGIVFSVQELARVINENAEEVMAGRTGNIQNVFIYDVFVSNLPFFALVAVFIFIPVVMSALPPKCGECGGRMELYKRGDNYDIYRCGNGHTMRRKRRRGYFFFVGGLGGGGGGGFGGGGGGGFGGGGSGGGGAGR